MKEKKDFWYYLALVYETFLYSIILPLAVGSILLIGDFIDLVLPKLSLEIAIVISIFFGLFFRNWYLNRNKKDD